MPPATDDTRAAALRAPLTDKAPSLIGKLLVNPQIGLLLVILLLGVVLALTAGSHVDARTGADGQQLPQLATR